MTILSSTFSVAMCTRETKMSTALKVNPASYGEVVNLLKSRPVTRNIVNPRHESTAALASLLTDVPCEGGFVENFEGSMVVVLPPREYMNRAGDEIEVADLEKCQFFFVEGWIERVK